MRLLKKDDKFVSEIAAISRYSERQRTTRTFYLVRFVISSEFLQVVTSVFKVTVLKNLCL